MTNGEKYKTAQERTEEFHKWCKLNYNADVCFSEVRDHNCSRCGFAWLDLECEENPLPCPFCGDECKTGFYNLSFVEICIRCGYRSEIKRSKAEAIAAHNRVAKKCLEVKE